MRGDRERYRQIDKQRQIKDQKTEREGERKRKAETDGEKPRY